MRLIRSGLISPYLELALTSLISLSSWDCCSAGSIVARSQSLGKHGHKSEIVDRRQAQKQPIIDFEEVMQVAARVLRAAQAIAHTGYRCIVFNIFVVVDINIR